MSSSLAQPEEHLLDGTRYRAMMRLAGGGMGEIYEAFDPDANEIIVVKLLRAELARQPDMVDRMRVEGEALSHLDHPNIVAGRGHGTTSDGRRFVAMERIEGVTLQKELRRRGALPAAEAIHYTRQLLSALGAVHAARIVHRDVKPENVMLCRRDGVAPRVKLLDFGIAKVTEASGQSIAPPAIPTLAGACVGTPRYASPEQARGAGVDRRSDIYAAGIVLYTLIAGRGPFDEFKGAGNVLKAHIGEEPPPPSRFTNHPLAPALEAVILRAIAKNADERFSDASSFSRELLLTMGKLCLPLALVPTAAEIVLALAERRPSPSRDVRQSARGVG
jgi:serine/threonine protein kinase